MSIPLLHPKLGAFSSGNKEYIENGVFRLHVRETIEFLKNEFPEIIIKDKIKEKGKSFDQIFVDKINELVQSISDDDNDEECEYPVDSDVEFQEDYEIEDTGDIEEFDFNRRELMIRFLRELMIVSNRKLINTFTFLYIDEKNEDMIGRTGPFDFHWYQEDEKKHLKFKVKIFTLGLEFEKDFKKNYSKKFITQIGVQKIEDADFKLLSKEFPDFDLETKKELLKYTFIVYINIPINAEMFEYWMKKLSSRPKIKNFFKNEIQNHYLFKELFSLLSISTTLATRSNVNILCYNIDFISKKEKNIITVIPDINQIFWCHLYSQINVCSLDWEKYIEIFNLVYNLSYEIRNVIDLSTGMIINTGDVYMIDNKPKPFHYHFVIYQILKSLYDRSQYWKPEEKFIFELTRGMENLFVGSSENTFFQFRYIVSSILTNFEFTSKHKGIDIDQPQCLKILTKIYKIRSGVAHLNLNQLYPRKGKDKIDDLGELEPIFFKFGDFLIYFLKLLFNKEEVGSVSKSLRELIFEKSIVRKKDFEDKIHQ